MRLDGAAEPAQLLLGSIAVGLGAARLERRGGCGELGCRAVGVARLRERPRRERPRQRRLDHRAGPLGGGDRGDRALRGCGGLAGVERDRRRGSLRPGGGHRQAERGRMRLSGIRHTRRLVAAIEVQVGRRESFETDRPPGARYRLERVAARCAHEDVDGALTSPGQHRRRATAMAAHDDRTLSSSCCVSSSASSAIASAPGMSPAATESSDRLRCIHAMHCVIPASRAASTPASSTLDASPSRPRMR